MHTCDGGEVPTDAYTRLTWLEMQGLESSLDARGGGGVLAGCGQEECAQSQASHMPHSGKVFSSSPAATDAEPPSAAMTGATAISYAQQRHENPLLVCRGRVRSGGGSGGGAASAAPGARAADDTKKQREDDHDIRVDGEVVWELCGGEIAQRRRGQHATAA